LQATHTVTLSSAAGGASVPSQLQSHVQTQAAAPGTATGAAAGVGSAQFHFHVQLHICGAEAMDVGSALGVISSVFAATLFVAGETVPGAGAGPVAGPEGVVAAAVVVAGASGCGWVADTEGAA
jgi:hypothetical protein